MLKLATWNVNSLPVRLEHVLNWLEETQVDVLAIQETKVINEKFPLSVFNDNGFYVAFAGQKTYNGVAIISRHPLTDIITDIPDFADEQRRILIATVAGIRLINLYVPNGSSLVSDKYTYKLNWLACVSAHIKQELTQHEHLAVVGDFNIAPEDRDVHDPVAWVGSVLVSPPERAAYFDILNLGLHDSFRMFDQAEQSFTWWDYRAASFRRNLGLRIDHILLSNALSQRCLSSTIDVGPRRLERPSDHTPLWVAIE